jgi:hypothetical protein
MGNNPDERAKDEIRRLIGEVEQRDPEFAAALRHDLDLLTRAAEKNPDDFREIAETMRALNARATQVRLRDFVDVLNRVLPWAGSVHQAFAWYRAQPIPSFGDLTAEDLVREGRTDELMAYLSRIAAGGSA